MFGQGRNRLYNVISLIFVILSVLFGCYTIILLLTGG